MSGPDELYPPAQYGWGWLLLAFGIVALLALAAWLVIALTRPRTKLELPGAGAPIPRPDEVLTMLRQEYAMQVDHVEAEYRAGRLDARRANLELSRSVRAFVNEYSGLEAPVLSLNDLVHAGVDPALVDAIGRHYYPSIFRRGPAIDPIAGAEAARRVVAQWH